MLQKEGSALKKLATFILLLLTSISIGRAAEYSASLKIQTGDAALDLHLNQVNFKASTQLGAQEVKKDLQQNYALSDRQIAFLSKQGYTLAEIELLALMAKESGKKIEEVAALHSKGIGWGVLAKRLQVQPSALRKLIVEKKKEEQLKESRRETGLTKFKEAPKGIYHFPRGGKGKGK